MGLLNGSIQSLFGTVFSTFYLDAELITVTIIPDGEGGGTEITSTMPVKVQQDAITEQMRATGGYTENDARFLILQAGVGELTSDCRLSFNDITYDLSNPQQDPARSYWAVRATPRS